MYQHTHFLQCWDQMQSVMHDSEVLYQPEQQAHPSSTYFHSQKYISKSGIVFLKFSQLCIL